MRSQKALLSALLSLKDHQSIVEAATGVEGEDAKGGKDGGEEKAVHVPKDAKVVPVSKTTAIPAPGHGGRGRSGQQHHHHQHRKNQPDASHLTPPPCSAIPCGLLVVF
jgi:hypothetical protein